LRRNVRIDTTEGSSYVVIRFSSKDPERARVGANAMVEAYRDLVRAKVEAAHTAALQQLDAAIATIAQAVAQNPAQLPVLNDLRARRSNLQVNARLSGDGAALVSEAERGSHRGASTLSVAVVSLVLGALTGTGIAYLLETFAARYARLRERFDAPALGDVPEFSYESIRSKLPARDALGSKSADAFAFLATVLGLPRRAHQALELNPTAAAPPMAARRSRRSDLLGTDAPTERRGVVDAEADASSAGDDGSRSVAFVAAAPRDGTSTIVANTALAAARAGDKVLVIDADFRGRGLARLLLGTNDGEPPGDEAAGLTDFLFSGVIPPSSHRLYLGSGGSLVLVEPGRTTIAAMNVIRTDRVRASLAATRDEFDRVFVDLPPILEWPYGEALVTGVDAVVLVASHRTAHDRLDELIERLVALDVRPLGYVRNLAPIGDTTLERVARRARASLRSLVPRAAKPASVFPASQPVPVSAMRIAEQSEEQGVSIATSTESTPVERRWV
jgi:Mrp family chromosome partitioning ATPase